MRIILITDHIVFNENMTVEKVLVRILVEGWIKGKTAHTHEPCSTGHQTGFIVRMVLCKNKVDLCIYGDNVNTYHS